MNLLIDNYDSFTYNIVHYLGDLDIPVEVIRNDSCSAEEALAMSPERVIISPGPGTPEKSGICLDVIKLCAERSIPLYGICLGMQAIGAYFGGDIIRAPKPIHGKTERITTTNHAMFKDVDPELNIVRYHSLIVDRDTLPDCLDITAENKGGLIMALAHKNLPLWGVQYHPESIASEFGHQMLKNFITESAA
jgi:anthranilate synthase component 2